LALKSVAWLGNAAGISSFILWEPDFENLAKFVKERGRRARDVRRILSLLSARFHNKILSNTAHCNYADLNMALQSLIANRKARRAARERRSANCPR
jgi:hypothetical protein